LGCFFGLGLGLGFSRGVKRLRKAGYGAERQVLAGFTALLRLFSI